MPITDFSWKGHSQTSLSAIGGGSRKKNLHQSSRSQVQRGELHVSQTAVAGFAAEAAPERPIAEQESWCGRRQLAAPNNSDAVTEVGVEVEERRGAG